MRSKVAELGLGLALAAASLGLVFSVLELGLRLVYGGADPYQVSKIVQYDGQLGWSLVPGEYEFFNVASFTSARFSIGELGLRSKARPKAQHRRITVFGDSFVFSEALSDGEVFTDLLQARLGPQLEIVNAGVPGFGTGQQALLADRLRSSGFDLGEKVLLVFFTNDISDNAGLKYGSPERDPVKPAFEVRGEVLTGSPVEPWPRREHAVSMTALARNSIAYALIRNRLEIVVAKNPWLLRALAGAGVSIPLPREPGLIHAWYAPAWQARWQRTEAILRHFARSLRAEGRELIVVFMPAPFQVEKVFEELIRSRTENPLNVEFLADIDRPQRFLRNFCAAERVRFVDLTPALRERRAAPAYFLREGHLNALGSAIVANTLHEAVSD